MLTISPSQARRYLPTSPDAQLWLSNRRGHFVHRVTAREADALLANRMAEGVITRPNAVRLKYLRLLVSIVQVVRFLAGVEKCLRYRIRIGTQSWPLGAFERTDGGRLFWRAPVATVARG